MQPENDASTSGDHEHQAAREEVASDTQAPGLAGAADETMDDGDDEAYPDWEQIEEVVERRVMELNNGAVTECAWSRCRYGTDDLRSADGILVQFEEDVQFLAEAVRAKHPQARNLRWNWLIDPPDGRHVLDYTLCLELTFEL